MANSTNQIKLNNLTAITETIHEHQSIDKYSTVATSKIRSNHSSSISRSKDAEKWKKLQYLKDLLDMGYITRTEYRDRMVQIVDELTGTHTRRLDKSNPIISKGGKDPQGLDMVVIPSPPPDFNNLPEENAIKHKFEIENDGTKRWIQYPVKIRMDKSPFARGGLRVVHHLMEYEDKIKSPQSPELENQNTSETEKTNISYVAKFAIDPYEDPDVYFKDVEMQIVCRIYAEKFNKYSPPRLVTFNNAWVLQLVDRPGQPLCNVELYLSGSYKKHNNNFGYVDDDDERNTPQAFSHFTYEASDKQLIVVDIQGVSDIYTDPQIHTLDEHIFGKGNLGKKGIDVFLQTHQCNSICRYLKLTPIHPKSSMDQGTVPAQPYMNENRIESIKIETRNFYRKNPEIRRVVKDEYRYLLGEEQVNELSISSLSTKSSSPINKNNLSKKSNYCCCCTIM